MSRQRLIIMGVFAILAVSLGVASSLDFSDEAYVYVQSDITKANPNISVAPTDATFRTEEISEIKHTVLLTIKGTVINVEDPINWTDVSKNQLGFVPVTVRLDEKFKDEIKNGKYEKNDEFTVYLHGVYESGKFYMHGYEPQFELGEEVILHVGHNEYGPDFGNGGTYFVELGKYGKYKIVDEKAYNEKHPDGKSLAKASNEAK